MTTSRHLQLIELPDGNWVGVVFPDVVAARDFQDLVEDSDSRATFRGCVPVVAASTITAMTEGTTQMTNDLLTELEFASKLTHLKCGSCDEVQEISAADADVYDIEDARDLVPACGCGDPIGYPEIRSDVALFGIPEIDDDYYDHGVRAWTYEVCDDLFDSLVEEGVATR